MRAIEFITEAREGAMREIIRKALPDWPDYVIKDWISSRIKNEEDLKNLTGWLGELNKQVQPNSWKLHQKMFLTFDMLYPKTRYFMKTKRQFGARNPFLIPRDEERSANAEQLVKTQGMENLPPVIMLQHANGLELCEGWHRTMAAFRLHPEGFYINAWIGQSAKQGVAEGVNDYLWHGSKFEHKILYPQQAKDIGGAKGSNKNAVYATPNAKFAIAMGLTTPGSDTGMFPNDSQMVLFSGKLRKGEYVYLHKVPKDLFIKHNGREWYSKPDVKEVKPIEIVTVPVDKYLNLIRSATEQDWKLRQHYLDKAKNKEQGVAEGSIKDLHYDLQDQQWDAIVGYVINGLKKNMDIGRIELNLYKYAGQELFDVDQALEDRGFRDIADLANHIKQHNGKYVPPTDFGLSDLGKGVVERKIFEINAADELTVPDELVQRFTNAGWQIVGEGRDQIVLGKPNSRYVLKIVGQGSGSRIDQIRRYIDFYRQNQRNPHWPRVGGDRLLKWGNKTYYAYTQEKLKHLPGDEAVLDYLEYAMEEIGHGREPDFAKIPQGLSARDIDGLMYAVDDLFAAGIGDQYQFDLSNVYNIMQRDNGQLVIVDPFAGWDM